MMNFMKKWRKQSLSERKLRKFHKHNLGLYPEMKSIIPMLISGFDNCTMLTIVVNIKGSWIKDICIIFYNFSIKPFYKSCNPSSMGSDPSSSLLGRVYMDTLTHIHTHNLKTVTKLDGGGTHFPQCSRGEAEAEAGKFLRLRSTWATE